MTLAQAAALVFAGFVVGFLYAAARPQAPAPLRVTVGRTPLDTTAPSVASVPPSATSIAVVNQARIEDDSPFLLVGVISSPASFGRRAMLRSFAEHSAGGPERRVRTEFVFGKRFYVRPPTAEVQQRLADESRRHGDVVFVDARERLPNVGKATEKSAAWWLSAPLRSSARFFCKTDDDTLIHHAHLASALAAAEAQSGSPNILFSYIRWRGWLPFHRFQACGGGWGGPIDAIRHLLDPKEHCDLAEGPFPQGTGQLTCLSRPLALALAESADFADFLRGERGSPARLSRATIRRPCRTHDHAADHVACAPESVTALTYRVASQWRCACACAFLHSGDGAQRLRYAVHHCPGVRAPSRWHAHVASRRRWHLVQSVACGQ